MSVRVIEDPSRQVDTKSLGITVETLDNEQCVVVPPGVMKTLKDCQANSAEELASILVSFPTSIMLECNLHRMPEFSQDGLNAIPLNDEVVKGAVKGAMDQLRIVVSEDYFKPQSAERKYGAFSPHAT